MPLRHLALIALAMAVLATGAPAARDNGSAPNTLTDAEKKAGSDPAVRRPLAGSVRAYGIGIHGGFLRWKIDETRCLCRHKPSPGRAPGTFFRRTPSSSSNCRSTWKVALGSNSGIKSFVLEGILNSAIGHEYQVIDDERHPDAKVGPHRQTAAFYDVLPASDRPLKPAGEWNSTRIVVRGQTVEHWLNGKKVLQYEFEQSGPECGDRKEQVQGDRAFRQAAERPSPAAGPRQSGVVP